jgi:hypothetical protein
MTVGSERRGIPLLQDATYDSFNHVHALFYLPGIHWRNGNDTQEYRAAQGNNRTMTAIVEAASVSSRSKEASSPRG